MNIANPAQQKTDQLLEAFSSFTEASSALERAYGDLQGKVDSLSERLEKSNYYLTTLLQNLPCGVMVLDKNRRITMINQEARQLFSLTEIKLPLDVAQVFSQAQFSQRAAEIMGTNSDSTEISLVGPPEKVLRCSWSRMRNGERVLVIQDVTRLRALEAQMRKTERIAAMGEMALEVAHEIRNPLGALELFASLLGQEDLSEDEKSRYLNHIQIGIRSLNTVLTNMLCFSKNSTGRPEPVVVGEVMQEIASFMTPLFDQRGIQVKVNCTDQVKILMDREMIRQILTNLITNALRALPEQGTLELSSGEEDSNLIISVRDNGIGIPEEFQQTIFESGFTTSDSGMGLGLAIVYRFVEAHGGRIEVESREGWGTRFTLSFPVNPEEEGGTRRQK